MTDPSCLDTVIRQSAPEIAERADRAFYTRFARKRNTQKPPLVGPRCDRQLVTQPYRIRMP